MINLKIYFIKHVFISDPDIIKSIEIINNRILFFYDEGLAGKLSKIDIKINRFGNVTHIVNTTGFLALR